MISLNPSQLSSRSTRFEIAGENRTRTIAPSGEDTNALLSFIQGVLGFTWQGLVSIGGAILSWVGSALSFGFTEAWGAFVALVQFSFQFNWQSTDQQLNQQIQGIQEALAARYGDFTGSIAGWIACGIAPSAGILAFNEPLGLYLLRNVGEEALDELAGQLDDVITDSLVGLGQITIIQTFKNTRQWFKKYIGQKDADDWEIQALEGIFGDDIQKTIDTWGDQGNSPWSFQKFFEDQVNSIDNQLSQNFVRGFFDSFAETCVEAGYVVAANLDNWVAQKQVEQDFLLGEESVLEIQPDRSIPDERFYIAGRQELVRSQLPQAITTHQLMQNRDVGQWVGEPVPNAVRQEPSELSLKIQLYSKKNPPFREAKKQASITVRNVKQSALDFDKIKRAVGGDNGYTWGRFFGRANLDDGYTIYCYASSRNEAEQRLKDLAELSNGSIQGITVSEQLKAGQRANGKPLEQESIRIYPVSIFIENKQKILNQQSDQQGFPTLDGEYSRKRNRIEIWREEKPPQFDQIVNELLTNEGVS